VSGDGRYVAFESRASNLVPGDRNQAQDIFVRDRLAGTTERVSVASDGAEADGPSAEPAVSADGRYVAFASRAKTLSRNDRNERWDVFLHDRERRETIPISVNAEGVHGNHDSTRPALSADGGYVAFESRAGNLVALDRNHHEDVFVRDRSLERTVRVSVGESGEGDRDSDDPSITGDGTVVGFESDARNLVSGDTNQKDDVFARGLGLNREPLARDDVARTFVDQAIDVEVLSNDEDPDGDALRVVEAESTSGASLRLNPDGTIHYAPPAGFHGTDRFTYRVIDGHGGSASAAVTVVVESVNQPPEVSAGPDQEAVLPGPVLLEGEVTDDGLPAGVLSIRWRKLSARTAKPS
jgi:hypothetical protein